MRFFLNMAEQVTIIYWWLLGKQKCLLQLFVFILSVYIGIIGEHLLLVSQWVSQWDLPSNMSRNLTNTLQSKVLLAAMSNFGTVPPLLARPQITGFPLYLDYKLYSHFFPQTHVAYIMHVWGKCLALITNIADFFFLKKHVLPPSPRNIVPHEVLLWHLALMRWDMVRYGEIW